MKKKKLRQVRFEDSTAESSGMLRRVARVRNEVSEEFYIFSQRASVVNYS
jgi:hypothetical protein